MYNVDSFGRYFLFFPRLIRRSHSWLFAVVVVVVVVVAVVVYLKGFDEKLRMVLSKNDYSRAWDNENNYEKSY